jgi:peptidoglycan/LPS O-acetylase OafA/YrhL
MLVFYLAYPWLLHFDIFLAFFLYVVLTTGVGAICYRLFEQPANLWVRTRFGLGNAGKTEAHKEGGRFS